MVNEPTGLVNEPTGLVNAPEIYEQFWRMSQKDMNSSGE
jgi:hypothetical protein